MQQGKRRALAVLATAAAASGEALASVTIDRCNIVNISSFTQDQHGTQFTITGLSGIAALPSQLPGGADRYVMVMDNSNKLVFITIICDDQGCITSAIVTGGLSLSETRDFEAIAVDAAAETVLLAEEGTPAIREYSLTTGAAVATISPPVIYSQRRANFGFESLTMSADGRTLWTCNEEALSTDGPLSTRSAGTWIRLQRFNRNEMSPSFVPTGQFAYRSAPTHGSNITGARSGVSELLLLDDGTLIAMERSFAFSLNGFFQSRFYELKVDEATDVGTFASINLGGLNPVNKVSLFTDSVNNMEGICLGRGLPGRSQSLIGVLDDGDPITVNSLVALRLTSPFCFADYNLDGGVDGGDVDSYFVDWAAGDSDADANSDGGIDGSDLAAFFTEWVNGGCS